MHAYLRAHSLSFAHFVLINATLSSIYSLQNAGRSLCAGYAAGGRIRQDGGFCRTGHALPRSRPMIVTHPGFLRSGQSDSARRYIKLMQVISEDGHEARMGAASGGMQALLPDLWLHTALQCVLALRIQVTYKFLYYVLCGQDPSSVLCVQY
ncbi:hypothetical protein DFH94DRAFT_394942 [Russula ochroleuca]|jgi:hypothetical protein|uniref:Uncharacterized protein n=1 Tax=Russula ochroleuca TaxID=152965 RepID=A0A9P5MPJ0_9AGAM|nr:hypothetical protein DFH94DRAFT_394942 [Russula ochroleuca]